MKTLTAKITDQARATFANPDRAYGDTFKGKNHGCEKETVSTYNIIAVRGGNAHNIITCRVYMGRSKSASTVTATVWLNGDGYAGSGSGQAGGYGYHKESAAVDTALAMAGVKLSRSIHGTGETEAALQAAARALGYKGKLLVITN